MVERPTDPIATEVLAIRLGMGAARALDRFAGAPVRLKWPNDLFVDGGKVCGILVESRWRDQRIEWVAVGMGINVRRPPDVPTASALRADATRVSVLEAIVPAIRAAAAARGPLRPPELAEYAQRDFARGRSCRLPAPGVVQGIDERGSLLVATQVGDVTCRSGSLVFEEDA